MATTLTPDNAASTLAAPGHNMAPTDVDSWFRSLNKLDKDFRKVQKDNGDKISDLRRGINSAKKSLSDKWGLFEKAGGNVKMLKKLIVEQYEDKEEVILDQAAEAHYRQALNMVIEFGDLVTAAQHATKAAMTNDSDDAAHAALESIEDKGYAAAEKGAKRKAPKIYAAESDEEYAWLKGYDKRKLEDSALPSRAAAGKGGRKQTTKTSAAKH